MKCSARWSCSSASLALALLYPLGAASAEDRPHDHSTPTGELRPAYLSVSVNGSPAGDPMMLLVLDNWTVYAPADALRSWRLKPWRPALRQDGVDYYALKGVPGLESVILDPIQVLLITASPDLLERTTVAAAERASAPMTPSATGGFFNYDLVGQVIAGRPDLHGLLETGLFTPHGVVISSFVGHWGGGTGLTRLETSWTREDPDKMRVVRLGDSISRGSLGANPVRFAGIQLARDFASQPGFVTIPLPSLNGTSEVPSVVDVYVNNARTATHELPPGPFRIENIPVVTGGGEVQLVVRDLLGRETLVRQAYYAAPQLLRSGLVDYSLEAGFLRRNFGHASFDYGSAMASATVRYGLTEAFTGEMHVEASPTARVGGIGASVAVPELGVLNGSAAVSNSARGVGTRYQVGLESRMPRLSYGAIAELISSDFVTVGTAADSLRPPRLTVQAFAGVPLNIGSLGVSYVLRDSREQPDAEFLAASASIRLGEWGTLYLTGRKSLRGPSADALLLSFTRPLGAAANASIGGELGQAERLRLSLQKNLPAGEGLGYRLAGELGGVRRLDGSLSYQTEFGTYGLDLSWVDAQTGLRVTASGGIGFVGDQVFAARKLSQSFATVKVGDYGGVRVYADNQQVATTNASGEAVIPRLRPFEKNEVRVEVADLPIDAQIDAEEKTVRPFDRSGVAVDFGVRPSHGAVVTLVRENGQPVPAGAAVRLAGTAGEFVVAPGGQAYLTGLGSDTQASATWQTGSCTFAVRYPDPAPPQPRLGPLACREN